MITTNGITQNLNFSALKLNDKANIKSSNEIKFMGAANVVDLYSPGSAKFAQALKPVVTNISFGAKNIGGIMYSKEAMALGDAMLKPEEVKAMVMANNEKIAETKVRKESGNYNNSRTGIVEAATVMGDSGKTYTSCNVDFFSSRWGLTAGQIASCMAMNDLNQTVKGIAVSDLNHDRKSLQWLANTNGKNHKTRGGRELQVVEVRKTPAGKDQVWVKTLSEMQGFVPKDLPVNNENTPPVKVDGVKYEPVKIEVNEIIYSDKAKQAANKLEAKGVNTEEMIKKLAQASQDEANRIEAAITESGGTYQNAPVSNYHYHSSLLADNGEIYSATNTEFYDGGFMADIMCSERTAVAKAVNDGANKAEILFLNNNQNHVDTLCAECLGWLSASARGGAELLLPTFIRDEKGNKTDKVMVHTLSELLPVIYVSSAKVEAK